MKTYLAYKNQVQGFQDVSETVKTIEKIAASSVHFLKQETISLNVYAKEIEKVLSRMSLFYQERKHPFLQERDDGKRALIILTGDKGLVGGLWHRTVSVFLENISQYQFVVTVGNKGANYLREENIKIAKSFNQISDISHQEIKRVSDYIFGKFKGGEFSKVDILYPKFVSLAEYQPSFISFLPLAFSVDSLDQSNAVGTGNQMFSFEAARGSVIRKEGKSRSVAEKKVGNGLPIFEPSKRKIFDRLLQKYISVFFYKIVIETRLSELSARTAAMEHASVKTEELIRKFTLDYTKERRKTITQKQLESFTAHMTVR